MGDRCTRIANWAAGDPEKAWVPSFFTVADPTVAGYPLTVGDTMAYAEQLGMVTPGQISDADSVDSLKQALIAVSKPHNLAGVAVKAGFELPLFRSGPQVEPVLQPEDPDSQAIRFLNSL